MKPLITAEQIATRLSPTRREALLKLPTNGSVLAVADHKTELAMYGLKELRLQPCVEAQLLRQMDSGYREPTRWCLTELGKQVQDVVRRQQERAACPSS